jgi:hypothetical protein
MTVARQRLGKHSLKAERVQPERMFIAEQRLGTQVSAAINSNKRVVAR